MRNHQIFSGILLGAALLTSASCAKPITSTGSGVPAESLRMASSVYADFAKMLSTDPKDNEFTKFASDPSNYHVTIVEDESGFIYVFHLDNFHGRPMLDGRVTYRVSKDGKVELKGKI